MRGSPGHNASTTESKPAQTKGIRRVGPCQRWCQAIHVKVRVRQLSLGPRGCFLHAKRLVGAPSMDLSRCVLRAAARYHNRRHLGASLNLNGPKCRRRCTRASPALRVSQPLQPRATCRPTLCATLGASWVRQLVVNSIAPATRRNLVVQGVSYPEPLSATTVETRWHSTHTLASAKGGQQEHSVCAPNSGLAASVSRLMLPRRGMRRRNSTRSSQSSRLLAAVST